MTTTALEKIQTFLDTLSLNDADRQVHPYGDALDQFLYTWKYPNTISDNPVVITLYAYRYNNTMTIDISRLTFDNVLAIKPESYYNENMVKSYELPEKFVKMIKADMENYNCPLDNVVSALGL